MATITIPKKLFEKEIGKLDEKMQENIALFGTPIENINTEELQLEIFPDRPDMLSYQGFKRAFLAFSGKKTGLKTYNINPSKKDYQVKIDSSVKNIWPYAVCAIVTDLQFDDAKIKELIEIQEKLTLTLGRKRKKLGLGIYPLDKIKLPITYKALEPDQIKFIPLESNKEMSGLEILQKHPTGKEYAHLLAGKAKFPIFIDSNKQILSMPPIINSHLTGKITTKTKDVFIEATGTNLELIKKSLNIFVTTLAEMGGKIYNMQLLYGKKQNSPDLTIQKTKISLKNTNKLLGLNLNEKQLKTLLEKMGHNYNKEQVSSPAWRTDIMDEVDLIEDVAIAYGYENFKPEVPEISTIGQEDKKESLKKKISDILIGLGILEISNYHLTIKNDQFQKMGISKIQKNELIQVKDSKTDYTILRKDLTHYLLKNLSENIDSEYPQKIFEIGKVFEEKTLIKEKEKIATAITPGNFTEIRQILEYLFKMTNIKLELKEPKSVSQHFIEGRVAAIIIKNKEIGYVGEIHPKILKNWKIKMPVSLFELDLDEMFEIVT